MYVGFRPHWSEHCFILSRHMWQVWLKFVSLKRTINWLILSFWFFYFFQTNTNTVQLFLMCNRRYPVLSLIFQIALNKCAVNFKAVSIGGRAIQKETTISVLNTASWVISVCVFPDSTVRLLWQWVPHRLSSATTHVDSRRRVVLSTLSTCKRSMENAFIITHANHNTEPHCVTRLTLKKSCCFCPFRSCCARN